MFEDKDERVEMETEGIPETGGWTGTESGESAGQVNFTMRDTEQEAQAGAEVQQLYQTRQEQAQTQTQAMEQAYQEQLRQARIQAQAQTSQAQTSEDRTTQAQTAQAQQTQYSASVQDGAAGGGTGTGSGSGSNTGRGGRKSRRNAKANTRIRRPYAKAIGCSVVCGVIIAACVIGSFAIGRNMGTNTTNVTIATNGDKLASNEVAGTITAEADTPTATATATSSSDAGEYTIAQIAAQCGSSVVAITNLSVSEVQTMFGYYEYESEGSGSGVIVGLDDNELMIVTNYHVVEDARELTVCFFDSEDAVYSAQIKGTDPNNDLAVVSIPVSEIDTEVLSAISIATIGDSDAMQVGDGVVAIGNALGLGQSVTSGIISAVNREVMIDNYVANLIQTDAAINPGNSGGALFNMKGELIGINSAKYASDTIEGMGFAIPTSIAQPIIEQLMSQETRVKLSENYGFLNITGNDVSTQMVQSYGMPQGVYVVSAAEGGAAANAGIQTGDIITALDGLSIPNMDTLKDRLQYYEAGESVEVTIARITENGYEERNIVVTLDNASDQGSSTSNDSDTESESSDSGFYGSDGSYYYGYGDGSGSYGSGDISDFFGSFFGQ